MKRSFRLQELASLTGSTLVGDPDYVVTGVADLESATALDASFLANARYEQAMGKSLAGVIVALPGTRQHPGQRYLLTDNPSRSFQAIIEAFIGFSLAEVSGFTGIHNTAVIHPTAKIGQDVTIGPHAVIDKDVTIGDRNFIGAGSYIGLKTTIGNDCLLHPRVTIRERCQIGNRVIIQPGVVIGSCGFGYTTDSQGKHSKINQVGIVIIEDDVEIGANSTIDRARFKITTIGRGSKIDNLVIIAHGVSLGEDNIIAAQTGIAGSTETGKRVILGGQVGVTGHLKIASDVMAAARTGITKSITKAGTYGGNPVVPIAEFHRQTAHIKLLDRYVKEIKTLQSNE